MGALNIGSFEPVDFAGINNYAAAADFLGGVDAGGDWGMGGGNWGGGGDWWTDEGRYIVLSSNEIKKILKLWLLYYQTKYKIFWINVYK